MRVKSVTVPEIWDQKQLCPGWCSQCTSAHTIRRVSHSHRPLRQTKELFQIYGTSIPSTNNAARPPQQCPKAGPLIWHGRSSNEPNNDRGIWTRSTHCFIKIYLGMAKLCIHNYLASSQRHWDCMAQQTGGILSILGDIISEMQKTVWWNPISNCPNYKLNFPTSLLETCRPIREIKYHYAVCRRLRITFSANPRQNTHDDMMQSVEYIVELSLFIWGNG